MLNSSMKMLKILTNRSGLVDSPLYDDDEDYNDEYDEDGDENIDK